MFVADGLESSITSPPVWTNPILVSLEVSLISYPIGWLILTRIDVNHFEMVESNDMQKISAR